MGFIAIERGGSPRGGPVRLKGVSDKRGASPPPPSKSQESYWVGYCHGRSRDLCGVAEVATGPRGHNVACYFGYSTCHS